MSATVERASAWIYEGVWSILTALFRVPREPPDLPQGTSRDVRRFRPAPGWLRCVKMWFWLAMILPDIGILVVWIVICAASPIAGAITAIPALIIAVVPDVIVYIGIHLKYDTTWYVLSDRSMRLRRGAWCIREATITYENIQNVTIDQGPVQRYFGIADVVVQTAGGSGGAGPHGHSSGGHTGRIEGIDNAAEVRDLIMDRVRRSRTAGLGDESHHELRLASSARTASPGLNPEHLAILRAIRDDLHAARSA